MSTMVRKSLDGSVEPLKNLLPRGRQSRTVCEAASRLLRARGVIAQLGERYNGIVEVHGSIPCGSTKSPYCF